MGFGSLKVYKISILLLAVIFMLIYTHSLVRYNKVAPISLKWRKATLFKLNQTCFTPDLMRFQFHQEEELMGPMKNETRSDFKRHSCKCHCYICYIICYIIYVACYCILKFVLLIVFLNFFCRWLMCCFVLLFTRTL